MISTCVSLWNSRGTVMPVECLADKRYAKAYSGIKAIGQETLRVSAIIIGRVRLKSARAVVGELDAVGFGVEAPEEFFDETCFYAAGFFRMDQVAHDGFEPGVFAHTE